MSIGCGRKPEHPEETHAVTGRMCTFRTVNMVRIEPGSQAPGTQWMEQQQKQKISGVLEQSHNLQSKITSQYAELHQILTEKEQRTLADIREEERKILNTMETNLGNIQENLESIQEELLKLQQQMDQNNSVVFLKEEAGRKRRVSDEAKPLSVVDEALPIEKFHCPVLFNTAFKETSDDFKRGKACTFTIILVSDIFKQFLDENINGLLD
ncbi:uncharacterized protein LOC129716098 [Leucoraja erinacea]|uniref:uncharacterized protein LOC129716098 n=1 Tax=Leucoraja erinaceus TaxID=7782 RepID=UPI002458D631|nr:uncharacterized protein LOC129716098 [Leucoraja erinacea]